MTDQKVPGQMGPHFMLTEKHCHEALKAILERDGAQNLVGELHRLMRARKVEDPASLFDLGTCGMVYGPANVVESLREAVQHGTADNHTYHFAMTAVFYAMELERLDPSYFRERKHGFAFAGFEENRTAVLEYVRSLLDRKSRVP